MRRRSAAKRDRGDFGSPEQPKTPTISDEDRARDICLRLLSVRPRTKAELASALRRGRIPDDIASGVLDRYGEVGIIDDAAFSRAWISSRHHGKGLARRALAGELHRKGIDGGVVGEALEELDGATEEATARELVRRRLRLDRRDRPDATLRRLVGMLARKGYPAGLAIRVVKEALEADADHADFVATIDVDALVDGVERADDEVD